MSKNTSEITRWIRRVNDALDGVSTMREEAMDALSRVEDAGSELADVLEDAPEGASNASIWDQLEEYASEAKNASRCALDLVDDMSIDDDDEADLIEKCTPAPDLSPDMKGEEIAAFIRHNGGCDAAQEFAASCPDLRAAWESCDQPEWLMAWAEYVNFPAEKVRAARASMKSNERFVLLTEGESRKVALEIQCKDIRAALGDDPTAGLCDEPCDATWRARQEEKRAAVQAEIGMQHLEEAEKVDAALVEGALATSS